MNIPKGLNVRDAGGAPCQQVRNYAHGLVVEMDRKIGQLRSEKRAMLNMIRQWDVRLAQTAPGARAHLLERDGIVKRGARSKDAHLRKDR